MSDWLTAQFFLSVFMDLNTTRPMGAMGGICYIPWDKVMYYADRLGLDPESAHHLWLTIRDVDIKYVKETNKKLEPKKPPPGANRNSLPRRTRNPL